MFKFLLLAFLLLSPSLSYAHSWYDNDCCSDNDCKAVDIDEVQEIEGGWKHLPTGTIFKDGTIKRIRPSQDKYFHVCIGNKLHDMGFPYCIYILQGF